MESSHFTRSVSNFQQWSDSVPTVSGHGESSRLGLGSRYTCAIGCNPRQEINIKNSILKGHYVVLVKLYIYPMNDAIIQTETFIFFLIKQAALKGKSGLFSHENKYNKLMSKNFLSIEQF